MGNIGTGSNGSPWIFNASGQNTKNIIVNGGTFNADILHQYYPFEVAAPKERALKNNGDGTWTIVDAVAYVNEQEWSSAWYTNELGYATLEEALAAAEPAEAATGTRPEKIAETVTLLKDAEVTGNAVVKDGTSLNCNGFSVVLAAEDATLTAVENLSVTTSVDDGDVDYDPATGTYKVVVAVAAIGETKYYSLQDAIDKAQDNDIITLLINLKVPEIEISTLDGKYNTLFKVAGKTVTVDLNGKKISGEYTGDSMLVGVFSTEDNGHLTLTGNGTIDVTATNTVYGLLVAYDATSSLTVENGTYTLDKASDSLIYTGGDENVTVNGGTFTLGNVGTGSNGSPWIFNAGGQNTANIIVTGGTFNADILHQHYPFEVAAPKERALQKNDNGTWTMVPAVAYVNEQEWSSEWYTNEIGYTTLEEALAVAAPAEAATSNRPEKIAETVTLLKDVEVAGNAVVKEGTYLDCNGFSVVLAAEDATLKAAKDLNVTTNVPGGRVVYEENTNTYKLIVEVAAIGDNYYETLQAAINACVAGDNTITLLTDCAETVTIKQTEGVNITIDGANKTMSGTVNVDGNGRPDGAETLTIKNVEFVNTSATTYAYFINAEKNASGGSSQAHNVTIEACSFKSNNWHYAIGTRHPYNLKIMGCTAENVYYFLYNPQGGNGITVENCTVTNATYGIGAQKAVNVSVKNYTYSGKAAGFYGRSSSNDSVATLENVNITTTLSGQSAITLWKNDDNDTSKTYTFQFKGENVLSTPEGVASFARQAETNSPYEIVLAAEDATLAATEGLSVITNMDGYKVVYENGVYKVAPLVYVAQIGETKYESLQAAVNAAQDGDTVQLIAPIQLTMDDAVATDSNGYKVLVYVTGKNIILDLNEKTISVDHQSTTDRIYAVVCVEDGASLTVTGNGTIDVEVNEDSPKVAYLFWKRGATGNLTIENGNYHMNNSEDSMVYTNGSEIVTVKGGTFTLDAVGTRVNGFPVIFNTQGSNNNNIIVTGGTYNFDVNHQYWVHEVYVPKELALKNNGNDIWTVVDAVAYVNEPHGGYNRYVGYATLEEAIATGKETVTLVQNAEVTGNVVVGESTSLVCGEYSVVLADAAATLTAAEGLNVTTNLADCVVDYENNIYRVVSKYVAQNKVTGVKYETVTAGLAEAKAGETVIILKDNAESMILVPEGIALDLNGYTLEASYVACFGDLVDNSADNAGMLKVDKSHFMIREDNKQLPVHTADGYQFIELIKFNEATQLNGTKYVFQPLFEPYAHELLLQGAKNSGITINIRVSWTEDDGIRYQDFVYNDEMVKQFIESYNAETGKYGKMFTLTLSGTEGFENLQFAAVVVSDTGAELNIDNLRPETTN